MKREAERRRADEIDAVRTAFGLLTQFPQGGLEVRTGMLGRAVGYFPLVGLALGAVAGVMALAGGSILPPWMAAVGVVMFLALATGGLHLDGLADTADGLGGGRGDRDRILEIMRDSRVGSFGVVALVIALLGKAAGLAALMGGEFSGGTVFWGIVLMTTSARWAGVAMIRSFEYARTEGLGRKFRDESESRELGIASVILVMTLLVAGQGGWIAVLLAGAAAMGIGLRANASLGGLTGDVYGAGIEVGEIVFLWGFVVLAA
jgi:adenosylcobinamide-GDP ribazoletransferase